jgi:hypothetical protein
MARYEIAFSAQLVPGAQLETVKANVAKLFQADEQRLALLFSGRRIVIKNNLDEAGAEKYRVALERAGALVEVVDMDSQIEEIVLTAPAFAAQPAAAVQGEQGRLKVAPRDEYMAAFSDVDAPDFGIAPLGNDLQDAKPEAQAPAVDLSQFSLAPVGSDMGELKRVGSVAVPDITHLKLQE